MWTPPTQTAYNGPFDPLTPTTPNGSFYDPLNGLVSYKIELNGTSLTVLEKPRANADRLLEVEDDSKPSSTVVIVLRQGSRQSEASRPVRMVAAIID